MTPEVTISGASKPTRIPADVAEKLDELTDFLGMSSAEFLDPIIRDKIEAAHRQHAKGIAAMRRARVAARQDTPFSNELGESGA